MKKVIVLSLGGSLIVPDVVGVSFLEDFRSVLVKHTKKYSFVVVCGGGHTARTYIQGLEGQNTRQKEFFQTLLGISSTRLNARFMTYFFGRDAERGMPHDMKDVKNLLPKNDIVFCGALRYAKDQTSDGTAAKLARYLDAPFVNLTNVAGLYDKDPKKYKGARFISEISYKDFSRMVRNISFTPGQHFVLDQSAARVIEKDKIPTFIIGPDMKQFDNFLRGKHFVGTVIGGKGL